MNIAIRTIAARLLAIAGLAAILVATPAPVRAQGTEEVSVGLGGANANGSSLVSAVSQDGRFVAFESTANNLVLGDTNNTFDIFVRELASGIITRVSVGPGGIQSNGQSRNPKISADGRFVVFESLANNLVTDDTNTTWDVFVHDRDTAITERVSVDGAGVEGDAQSLHGAISADGTVVVFESDATNLDDVLPGERRAIYLRDRTAGATELASLGLGGAFPDSTSLNPAISADGMWVAYESFATNLVAGDGNGRWDVFVYDRAGGATSRASVDSNGVEGASDSREATISADGSFVAFQSISPNLVPGDTNNTWDIFVRDRVGGTTERVSVDSFGQQSNALSMRPKIDASGRYIAFESLANNLVTEDSGTITDIFVFDRTTRLISRVSVATDGTQANANSAQASAPSAGGQFVSFNSMASNLVPGDTLGFDVFVHDSGAVGNLPPVADAGPDQVVEATGPLGALVSFDGSGSSDPDPGDNLSYAWAGPFGTVTGIAPTAQVPLGTHVVSLTVTDTSAASDGDTVQILVQDTTPPVITAPADVTATAIGMLTPVAIGTASAVDLVDGPVAVTSDAPAQFAPGTTVVTWSATDAAGNTATATQTVTVLFDFIGFTGQTENPAAVNAAQAGSAVRVMWRVGDGAGGFVSDPAIVTSLMTAMVDCGSWGAPWPGAGAAASFGQGGVRYDTANERFVHNWATERAMDGQCAVYIVGLADGSTHAALFTFVKGARGRH